MGSLEAHVMAQDHLRSETFGLSLFTSALPFSPSVWMEGVGIPSLPLCPSFVFPFLHCFLIVVKKKPLPFFLFSHMLLSLLLGLSISCAHAGVKAAVPQEDTNISSATTAAHRMPQATNRSPGFRWRGCKPHHTHAPAHARTLPTSPH